VGISTINLVKNHNRMHVVGTGSGVKKGWKSEMCSGRWTINMPSSLGGGGTICDVQMCEYTTNYVQKKMTKMHYY